MALEAPQPRQVRPLHPQPPVPRLAAIVTLSTLFLGLAPASAEGQRRRPVEHFDVWSAPNPGIRYLHRTTTLPCSIHALVADLRVEGVRVETTPHAGRWRAVGDFARDGRYAAAVNGGFWGTFARAQGVTAGGGERWPDGDDDEEHGFFAVTRGGRAWISAPEELWEEIPDSRLAHAVSGRPMLVRDGTVDREGLEALEWARRRHPRTAVGISRDGRKVVLVVADGRQAASRGMTLFEVAELMVELGAHSAINLDGGGSSALFVERLGGVVSAPSGGRWEARLGLGAVEEGPGPGTKLRTARDGVEESYVRGVEREVMNHIGVTAPAPADDGRMGRDLLGGVPVPYGVATAPPRSPPLRLGAARELLYPAAWGLAGILPMVLAGLWIRRRRRRRLGMGSEQNG